MLARFFVTEQEEDEESRFLGVRMKSIIIAGGRVVVDGCTNDGSPADGGRCGHHGFIEKSISSQQLACSRSCLVFNRAVVCSHIFCVFFSVHDWVGVVQGVSSIWQGGNVLF